jgi:hypothetical protein
MASSWPRAQCCWRCYFTCPLAPPPLRPEPKPVDAAISVSVGFFYKIQDPKLHTVLVGLTAAFPGIVLFRAMINDRPFAGDGDVSPASDQLILDKLIDRPR